MQSIWLRRGIALAIFLGVIYGVSELVHGAVERGLTAWLTFMGLGIAIVFWMDDREREWDGRPRTSWQTVREDIWQDRKAILVPVFFWGSVIAAIYLLR
jgi:hypothetical protein